MKQFILLTVLVAFAFSANAQQDPQFSMYMFNGQYINPGYVGSKNVLDISGLYRYQWAGNNFDGGAPQSGNVGFHMPFKKKQYAFGLVTGFDHIGATDMYNLIGQFAYRIPVKKSTISLGIQTGFYHFNDNKDGLRRNDEQDPFFQVETKAFIPNFGTGVYVFSKRYYVGVSIPHLINMNINKRLDPLMGNTDVGKQYRHLIATAGVVIGKENANIKVKPSILLKYVEGVPGNIPDIDFNTSILFIDRIWVGASVRTGGNDIGPYISDVVGMVEFLATEQLRVGYAYDFVVSDLRTYTGGSHEVMLGYQFGAEKKKFVNVRYGTYF